MQQITAIAQPNSDRTRIHANTMMTITITPKK